MTLAKEIHDASLNVTKVKVMKGLHRKPYRGSKIKVSTPGSVSAGAGSLLKHLRSSMVSGKACDRNETSSIDNKGGKRAKNSHVDNSINKVLSDLESGSLDSHLKFLVGSSVEYKEGCALSKAYEPNDFVNGNDGSFIYALCDKTLHLDGQCKPVAKSSGLMTGVDPTCMGDVGSMSCDQTSSKDGIAIAEIGSGIDVDMAGPSDRGKLASMEDVVGTGLVLSILMDGIASDKGGDKFEFGKISSSKEKLKKGSEEVALNMEYIPSAVSKMENGNRRIMFSAKEVIKGGQAWYMTLRRLLRQTQGFSTSNLKEPGIWFEKIEPSFIPIWVCVHNIPMELCNDNGIGKIISGVGKPMLMDRMTKEQCLKKAKKLDFARVLAEVSANEDLPNVLEIAYPPIGNREAKVGKLEVKYQWKPPLCTHCKTFGLSFLACKLRPRIDVERAAKIVKDASNLKGPLEENYNAMKSDEEGFTQGNSQNSNQGNVGSKGKSYQTGSFYVKKNVGPSLGISDMSKDNSKDGNSMGKQDLRQLSKDSSFTPKVLVRGSISKVNSRVDCNDPIPTMNSFSVLVNDFIVGDDSDIKKDKSCVEEFESIWPDLKSEVDILMEADIYPSMSVRLYWTVNQMDYFYKNCHKYHLDQSYEDEDVESEYDGISMSMKPEFELDAATNMENGAAHASNVSNASICSRVLGHWEWVSNNASCSGGTRIIVGWDPNCVNVMIMEQSAQAIHCFVELINGDLRSLWKSLRKYKQSLRNSSWVILGDFNSTLDPSEKSSGCSRVTITMSDFRDCVADIEVEDISMSGLNFTWNNSPGKVGGLLKKLDRIIGNVYFITSFPTSYARFLPFMTSDHTPAVFVIPEVAKAKPKPFKFHNYLTGKDGFIPAVKKLNFDQGNLFANVEKLKKELATIQYAMVSNPFSSDLREAELSCLKAYKEALKDEGRISVVEDMNGVPYFGVSVGEKFVNHFQCVLGKCSKVLPISNPEFLFTNKLSEGDAAYMIRDISDDEVEAALFDIDNNKAPRLDGYSFQFFKDAWNVIAKEFCKAVREFFNSSKLLKEGKRGLRQGDPLSPYLFTLVIEVLNLMIKKNIAANPHFKYHWKCKDLKITHLCFADDLMLFCHGDSKSVAILKKYLEEFGSVSGLFPRFPKSTVFFGNVNEISKNKILKVMPFIEGKLPVRYLGAPLLSKRLYVNDCSLLVDKVKKRILDWKNKSMSFAGRLQLILSVVGSMQVYWSSMFILPITISNEVERLMRDFLWNFGDFKRGKARIKWDDVCKPKVEGGLDSLWVKWVHVYKLKGINFWDILEKEGSSWSWKKILRYRSILRSHIVHGIGNGLDTSLLFDNWHAICPLSEFISKRKIYYSGLSLDCKVANVIDNGVWKWPRGLSMEFDGLNAIEPPCLTEGKKDKVLWKTGLGRLSNFSVNNVWNDLRVCSDTVPWVKIVWCSQCIPMHAFMVWLAIHGRLRTQDLMVKWEKYGDMRCVFCKNVLDSHDHLFFECEFSKKVWDCLKCMVIMDDAPDCWSEIKEFMMNRPINKSIWSILQRLLLGASIYFIWHERNGRMFQDKARSVETLICLIKETVRLRIMSLSLNDSKQVSEAASFWNFHMDRDAGLIMFHMVCIICFGPGISSYVRDVYLFGLQAHVKKMDWIKVHARPEPNIPLRANLGVLQSSSKSESCLSANSRYQLLSSLSRYPSKSLSHG
nr:hypothetical protein [Tanacetum cinerariifolium]